MRNNIDKFEWDIEVLSREYPLFRASYDYLFQKHNKFELTVSETLKEITMSNTDFYEKKKAGIGIPCYRQKTEKARITFPIICVALFLAFDFFLVGEH
jgi:hypothetical protein